MHKMAPCMPVRSRIVRRFLCRSEAGRETGRSVDPAISAGPGLANRVADTLIAFARRGLRRPRRIVVPSMAYATWGSMPRKVLDRSELLVKPPTDLRGARLATGYGCKARPD
jgi:hypothetical protein